MVNDRYLGELIQVRVYSADNYYLLAGWYLQLNVDHQPHLEITTCREFLNTTRETNDLDDDFVKERLQNREHYNDVDTKFKMIINVTRTKYYCCYHREYPSF